MEAIDGIDGKDHFNKKKIEVAGLNIKIGTIGIRFVQCVQMKITFYAITLATSHATVLA